MNYGGLSLIEHSRGTRRMRLLLPRDLLRTLSITDGSTLEGIFYPGRLDDVSRRSHAPSWDFAFSPVPYRLWPKVGRIRARLVNEPGSIAAFAKLLADNGVSILHSEYSRSGYRFATWNFVVVFDVTTQDEDFDQTTTTYKPTVQLLKNLEKEIGGHKAPFLFAEKDDVQFRDSIDIWPLTTLSYFHHLSRDLKRRTEDAWLYEPFSLSCENGALYCNEFRFPAILGKLGLAQDNPLMCVYTDISTTDTVLRTALIPSSDESRFVEVIVDYDRAAPPDTSRGFCAHIARMFPESMRIWNLTNYTSVNTPYSEIGGTRLLVENLTHPAAVGQALTAPTRAILERIRGVEFRPHEEQIFSVRVKARPISGEQVWSEIMREKAEGAPIPFKYDIFFSYAERDLGIALDLRNKMHNSDLKCFMARRDLQGQEGDEFAEAIRQALITSREVVVLCSPNAINSTWVTTEWAAAWALGKRITPILYQVAPNQLPDRLQRLQGADVGNIDAFLQAATTRKERW